MVGSVYRPEDVPFWEGFKTFLYNQQTGAVFGRTASSWAKILIFYAIFYICLAAFFSLMMLIVFYTLDPRIPKYQLDGSLIGTSPGMGFRPMPNDSNSLSTLIWYKGTRREDSAYWVSTLNEFLEPYRKPGLTPGRGSNIYRCTYGSPAPPGKVCEIDIKHWSPCTAENYYNYHLQGPCVFIKLNKIFGWVPEFYKSIEEIPKDVPDDLMNYLIEERNKHNFTHEKVYVSCQGESPADAENVGQINYIPERAFPGYFFPYENSEGYLSPLIALHFVKPKPGVLINVECQAWAKNIVHDRRDRLGSVHFELLID